MAKIPNILVAILLISAHTFCARAGDHNISKRHLRSVQKRKGTGKAMKGKMSMSPPRGYPSSEPSRLDKLPGATVGPSSIPSTIPVKVKTTPPTKPDPSTVSPTVPILTRSLIPSITPSWPPTLSRSFSPTWAPSFSPTLSPTWRPSFSSTSSRTAMPSDQPVQDGTLSPTQSPTWVSSAKPTGQPTSAPTPTSTPLPTNSPSARPTEIAPRPTYPPSRPPTASPSNQPTPGPTGAPTAEPTTSPTPPPTTSPTQVPSLEQTPLPTRPPTPSPTLIPTRIPTPSPTPFPTPIPTPSPTPFPTLSPTPTPTPAPTQFFEPVGEAPEELTWADIVDDYEDIDGNTGKVRVIYVDVDLISKTRVYQDNPYWWNFYRSFWDEDGDFVNNGRLVEQGTVGRDCFGLEWYADATKQYTFERNVKYSTRYCHPVSRKNSNEYCSVYMTNHYRGPINDNIRPGLDTRGPTYYDIDSRNRPGVNMNFEIHIDEYMEFSRETFSCYAAGAWRNVKPGEVTPDGYGIVPQSAEPEGSFPTPYFKWLFIVPKDKKVRLARCKPGTCQDEPLTETGYVRIVDPPLVAVSDEELFRRSLESHALGVGEILKGVDLVSMTNQDIQAEGFYFLVKVNGKWTRSPQPINFFDGKWNKNLDWITTCNCMTLNGSGNHFEDGIDGGIAMAEELGRDFSIHYYMPTSMGYGSYENHNAQTRIPEMISQIADWAADNNMQLDIRGHSWSSWLLWRACGESRSKCSNIDLTTYAPATLPEHWGDIFFDMYEFKGNGNVVYGSQDILSRPSLKNVVDNTGNLNNVNFDRLPGVGHTLKDILNNHNR